MILSQELYAFVFICNSVIPGHKGFKEFAIRHRDALKKRNAGILKQRDYED